MDNQVQESILKEEQQRLKNEVLIGKYRNVLKRSIGSLSTIAEGEEFGKQKVVYDNEVMLDVLWDGLVSNHNRLGELNVKLEKEVDKCRCKLDKFGVGQVQRKVEVLDQQIRMLEHTVRLIERNQR